MMNSHLKKKKDFKKLMEMFGVKQVKT